MGKLVNNYKYTFRYCTGNVLGKAHGFGRRTLDRWISEEKDKGKTIPGRMQIPGTRSFIYEPEIFHDEFLLPKILGTSRNEIEDLEHKQIYAVINNLNERRSNL